MRSEELRSKEDVQVCKEKIIAILKEYGCEIQYDIEVSDVIIVDVDTERFEFIYKY